MSDAMRRSPFHGVTRNVVALGVVSLLTDVSSEMIVPILPLFVTASLGASVASLGVIEGVGSSTSSLIRLLSGWLSDRSGRRTPWLAAGYGLSTVARGALALAGSWAGVLALRFADRVGKGLRNPPRDALIADSVAPAVRGRAFGLHRGLDTLGAALGPLVAFALLAAWPGDFRRVFAISIVPALLSLVVLALLVRERAHAAGGHRAPSAPGPLGAPFRRLLIADGLFQLGATGSMSFVLLRSRDAGLRPEHVPLAYLAYNVVYAALSFPVGVVADRFGRRTLLLAAYASFVAAFALLAWRATPAVLAAALVVLGLHSAMLEVARGSLIADLVPAARRGTAYGAYHTVVGLVALPAGALAGLLWDRLGAAATFALGALCALAAAIACAWLLPSHREHEERHADAA